MSEPNWNFPPGYREDFTDEERQAWEDETRSSAEEGRKSESKTDSRLDYYKSHLLSSARLFDLPSPIPLIDGLFDLESMVFLYGEPKSYKSFVALDWGLSIAAGLPWEGHPVERGTVLYVAAEGSSGIPDRIRAWVKHRTPMETLPPKDFYLLKVPVPMGSPVDALAITELALELGAKLVVLDTLARCSAGLDENSSKDMGILVHHADHLKEVSGATVLFVHHSLKSNKSDLRGSSALKGAADSVFSCKRAGDGQIKLTNTDQKNHAETPEIVLLVNTIELAEGATSVTLTSTTKMDSLKPNEQKALDKLYLLCLKGTRTVTLAEWGRHLGVDDMAKSGKWLRTAKDSLVAKGFVLSVDGGYQTAPR